MATASTEEEHVFSSLMFHVDFAGAVPTEVFKSEHLELPAEVFGAVRTGVGLALTG